MNDVHISVLGVLLAAAANMIIGALWYSPLLFGGVWMKTMGKRQEDMKGGAKAMAIMAGVALLTAYILAHFADYVRAHTPSEGAQLGLWVWLGFVVTSALTPYIFEERPKLLYAIFIGYQLVSFLAMGIILSYFT